MPTPANNYPTQESSRTALYEVLALMSLALLAQFLPVGMEPIIMLLPIIYLLLKRKARHRSWQSVGFKRGQFINDLKRSLPLIFLVAIVIQTSVFLLLRTLWPEILTHILGRIPFDLVTNPVAIVLPLLIGTLAEEMTFRALFQERLSWYIQAPLALFISSSVFALAHASVGQPAIVAVDMLLVLVDSLIYGLIYAKTRNVTVSWCAHFLANVCALILWITLGVGV